MFAKRSSKIAFLQSDDKFYRMKGFTSLSINKNAGEYTRQYVDEDFETTDVVRISTSMDFNFDYMPSNPVHDKLVEIIDGEKIGDDAVISILVVDFSEAGTESDSFKAVKRDFVVVPGTEGDSLDAYTYSGTFRVKGPRIEGEATSADDWQTCTFTPDEPEEQQSGDQ